DSSNLDSTIVQIAAKNLKHRWGFQLARVLKQHHRHGVGLFAGSARWYPNADKVTLTFVLKQLRHQAFKRRKRMPIREEIRDRNDEVLLKSVGLARMRSEKDQVGWEFRNLVNLHPARDPANDRRSFVVGKVVARPGPQELERLAQGCLALQ